MGTFFTAGAGGILDCVISLDGIAVGQRAATSNGDPVPGFVACLKRLDAPQDVIDSWTGG